jgi:hypothetical protein
VSVDLASWLLEQITADERAIDSAGPGRVGWATWRHEDGSLAYTTPVAESTEDTWVTAGHRFTVKDPVLVVFDPVERRAELRSKRFLLVMFSEMLTEPALAVVHPLASNGLKAMALPYAHRAGYQAGWTP